MTKNDGPSAPVKRFYTLKRVRSAVGVKLGGNQMRGSSDWVRRENEGRSFRGSAPRKRGSLAWYVGARRIDAHGVGRDLPPPPKSDLQAESRRGKVKGFSRKSRKSMLDFVASIPTDDLDRPKFLTLTYWKTVGGPSDWKDHLRCLIQRMQRKYRKEISVLWRIEPQKRIDPATGEPVPHFHLLIWGIPEKIDWEWLRVAWSEIVYKSKTPVRLLNVDVRFPPSTDVAGLYVAKYMSKDCDGLQWGRMWGKWGVEWLNILCRQKGVDRDTVRVWYRAFRKSRKMKGYDGQGRRTLYFRDPHELDRWMEFLDWLREQENRSLMRELTGAAPALPVSRRLP